MYKPISGEILYSYFGGSGPPVRKQLLVGMLVFRCGLELWTMFPLVRSKMLRRINKCTAPTYVTIVKCFASEYFENKAGNS